MLIWGSGGKTVELGNETIADCPTCEKPRKFRDVLTYRYAHIWYLFRWVTKRAYHKSCEICGRGNQYDTKAYESQHGKGAVPAFYRFGLWALLGLAAAFIAFVVVVGTQSDKREAELLKQPQVGDLYSVDLQGMAPGAYEDGARYGVMRVTAVEGGKVTLQLPNHGYNKLRGVSGDLSSGETGNGDYFSEDAVTLDTAELASRHDKNDIYDVKR